VHRTKGTRRCANGGYGKGARSGYIEKMHISRLRIRALDKSNAWVCKWRRWKRGQKWVYTENAHFSFKDSYTGQEESVGVQMEGVEEVPEVGI
jgi:hypothetical protein